MSENATFELKKSRTIEDRIDKLQKKTFVN